jgi:hypothetical protein
MSRLYIHAFRSALLAHVLASSPAGAVASAELIKNEAHGYGRFEARVRFAPGDGVVSSFFLWKPDSEMADVFWNELDIEKLGADCSYSSNAIYGLPQSNHSLEIMTGADLCGEYRTHAFEWTPDYIAWFLNGSELRRLDGAHARAFADNAPNGMQIRFNVWPGNASFGGNFSEAVLPTQQFVNWVAYYEYTPGAGDDGGDFRFAWREDFDSGALPGGWSAGTWASPFSLSTHDPANVEITSGVAVLSLTSDTTTGFRGTPPGDAVGGDAGSFADGSTTTGCGCGAARHSMTSWPAATVLLLLGVGWRRRVGKVGVTTRFTAAMSKLLRGP